jgi:hypothetical protein
MVWLTGKSKSPKMQIRRPRAYLERNFRGRIVEVISELRIPALRNSPHSPSPLASPFYLAKHPSQGFCGVALGKPSDSLKQSSKHHILSLCLETDIELPLFALRSILSVCQNPTISPQFRVCQFQHVLRHVHHHSPYLARSSR